MRVVRPCDTHSCERDGSCQITNQGKHLAWHCGECIETIENILEATSTMVKLGTPRSIAADWAAGRERRRA